MIAMLATFLLAATAVPAHPPMPADADFAAWVTQDGVVETRAQPKGLARPFVRGTSEIDASCDAVKGVLVDFAHYKTFFSGIVREAKVLAQDDASARIHFVWAYPWPLHDRDSVVGYTLTKPESGGWLLSWQDDAQSGDPKDGVRIAHVEGATRMVPKADGACTVSYTYYGDLGIDLTKAMNEKILRTEPVKYVEAIRKGLNLPKPAASATPSPRTTPPVAR